MCVGKYLNRQILADLKQGESFLYLTEQFKVRVINQQVGLRVIFLSWIVVANNWASSYRVQEFPPYTGLLWASSFVHQYIDMEAWSFHELLATHQFANQYDTSSGDKYTQPRTSY
jgi:hypothetical protein